MELSQRLDLAALNLGEDTRGEESTDQSTMARFIRLVADVAGIDAEAVTAERTLEEAGVSSLDRIELAVRAEEMFGARAEDGPYTDSATVGEIVQWLTEHEEQADRGTDAAG